MASPRSYSGLSAKHRQEARSITVAAAVLALKNAKSVHYTQGPMRWQGIDKHLVARLGQYPKQADCSSFVTWCLWNALAHHFHLPDIVNGANWKAGWTGSLYQHGKIVHHDQNIQRGDVVLYGVAPGHHTALCVGGGKIVSHGSESAPYLLPIDYRSDRETVHRFI